MLFSRRKGYKPLEKEFQRESISDEMRNKLWSALVLNVWRKWSSPYFGEATTGTIIVERLLDQIWVVFFEKPVDTRPQFKPLSGHGTSSYEIIRDFFFTAEWYEVYDFLEFVVNRVPDSWQNDWKSNLVDALNAIFEIENAAYRLIDGRITEITDEKEIAEIEEALRKSADPTRMHIQQALNHLSDRKNPDYRNSIKESISAVEATLSQLTGHQNASLGEGLKSLGKNTGIVIHPALEAGFLKIYGYTSSSGGIRHALTDKDYQPTFAEAKFMLVACSAFVNYLRMKASETK